MEVKFFLWKSTSSISTFSMVRYKREYFAAQDAFSHRAEMNKLASLGKWSQSLEE